MSKHLVVIPAAGRGTRFHELGRLYPKCLLPYKGKPVLKHLVEKINWDLAPEMVRVVRREEDQNQPLWDCVSKDVQFVTKVKREYDGPAASIYDALEGLDLEDCRVTVILSDMVLNEEFPLNCVPRLDGLFVFDAVDDHTRWCNVRETCSPAGLVFYDKPTDPESYGYAALGVYSFQSGMVLQRVMKELMLGKNLLNGEVQISSAMRMYQSEREKPLEIRIVCQSTVADIGTLEEFLGNRVGITSREFNSIRFEENAVIKLSQAHKEKIRNEALWLQNPPDAYKYSVPRIHEFDTAAGWYSMQRIRSHNLRDLALYYDKSYETWSKIFGCVSKIIDQTRRTVTKDFFWQRMLNKTIQRTGGDESTLYQRFEEDLHPFLSDSTPYHGDLHFANMFFDGYQIFVVDPRGEYYGHWLYDVAKLVHSVFGKYDYIDEDLYFRDGNEVVFYDRGCEEIQRAFREKIWNGLDEVAQRAVITVVASLFASMVPLHKNPEHQSLFLRESKRFLETKNPTEV